MTDRPAPRAVILGAGRGVRGPLPSAVETIGGRGRVLDWLLEALGTLGEPEVTFVAGFRAEEVLERYPGVRIVLNRDWEHTGPVGSLLLAPLSGSGSTYVSYADVVYRPSAVRGVAGAPGEVAVAVDTSWRARYDGREAEALDGAEKVALSGSRVTAIGRAVPTEHAAAEFAGLLRLDPDAARACLAAVAEGRLPPTATLPDLVTHCLDAGLAVTAVDLAGDWAELDAKQDLARFVLGTKAESLERLRPMTHGGAIGRLVAFTHERWTADPERALDAVLDGIPTGDLIVRSSARSEDGWLDSGAGRHLSVADVPRDRGALRDAIDAVFASYSPAAADDQVLVQEMLRHVVVSGVVMTRTHAVNAPYYVINFDDASSRTDTVTSGGAARTLVVHRDERTPANLPSSLRAVLDVVRELEQLVGHDSLDIEFAVTADGTVHVLQVRPITVSHVPAPVDDAGVARVIDEAAEHLRSRRLPSPSVLGASLRYSVMTDWNPAEIIGTKPRRLALSLYRRIITDEVWAQQRAEYGYRDVRPCPLLVDVAGHPYVDVRASFTSFVPAALDDDLAGRLVDHYLDALAREPHLHDKVEFEVVLSCLTADWPARAGVLREAGFPGREVDDLQAALAAITLAGVARLPADLAALDALDARVDTVLRSGAAPLPRALHLLDAARRIGTPAFAHLARAGFVATSLLRSLVAVGAIDADEHLRFLASVETVLGQLRADAWAVRSGDLDWDVLVRRYGHLRPGTYDITSPCYAAAPEAYLRPIVDGATAPEPTPPFTWSDAARTHVPAALEAVGLPITLDELTDFARGAIAGREAGKFAFTRALSASLEALAEHGAEVGIGRDDLAHVPIDEILQHLDVLPDPAEHLRDRARAGREAYALTHAVCLPAQLSCPDDLVCFEQEQAEPNFVTHGVVEARVVVAAEPTDDIADAIVVIPTADPGFDWMLARDIAGLITMYGGANSHMAVRAAELGLPAAIGVGEARFRSLESAGAVRLDCASRTIEVLR